MECLDCGVSTPDVFIYSTKFEMKLGEESIIVTKFNKPLCSKCLHGNVYALKGELEFMHDELGEKLDDLDIYINPNLVGQ